MPHFYIRSVLISTCVALLTLPKNTYAVPNFEGRYICNIIAGTSIGPDVFFDKNNEFKSAGNWKARELNEAYKDRMNRIIMDIKNYDTLLGDHDIKLLGVSINYAIVGLSNIKLESCLQFGSVGPRDRVYAVRGQFFCEIPPAKFFMDLNKMRMEIYERGNFIDDGPLESRILLANCSRIN